MYENGKIMNTFIRQKRQNDKNKKKYSKINYVRQSALNWQSLVCRRDWCARWGDYCVPGSRVRFATCCGGLRCVCGSLWMSGKCQCKTPSVFGR